MNREGLEKTIQTLLKRLKQKDNELKEYDKRPPPVAESQSDAIEVERQNFQEEKKNLEHVCEKAVSEKEAAEIKSKELSTRVDDLTSRLKEYASSLDASETDRKALDGKLRELQDLDDALQIQVSSLKAAMESAMEERDAAFGRLGEERDRRMEMESLLSDAQHQIRQMKTEMQQTNQTASDASETEEKRKDVEARFEAENRRLHEASDRQLEQKEEIILELRRDIERLQERCEKAVASRDDAVSKIEAMAQQNAGPAPHEGVTLMAEDKSVLDEELVDREVEEKEETEGGLGDVTEMQHKLQEYEETIVSLKAALQKARDQMEDTALEQSKDALLTGDRFSQLEEEIQRLNAVVEEYRDRSQNAQAKADAYASIERAHASLQASFQSLEETERGLQSKTTELTKAVHRLETELDKQRNQSDLLKKENLDLQASMADQSKTLKTELDQSQRHRYKAEDHLEQLEKEVGQLKEALNRTSNRSEEEAQAHRIIRQRLNDEQETSKSLKQQLQEAFSKMQSTEVESWKQQEDVNAREQEREAVHLKEKQLLDSEIQSLKETVASQEQQLAHHVEDLDRVRETSESEKEKLKKAVVEVKKRLDRASAQLKRTEIEGTEQQTSHYAEKEKWMTEISHHQHQAEKIAAELKDYKTKAHLLVKTRDEELNALKTEIQHRADVEVDLKVLREKFDDLAVERDNLREELNQANEGFQSHLDDLVTDFQMQIQERMASMLEAESQREELQRSIQEWKSKNEKLEEAIHVKSNELTALEERYRAQDRTRELDDLRQRCQSLEKELKNIKDEFSAYRKTTEQMSEVQQLEMSRLIQSNLELRKQTVDDNLSTISHRLSGDRHSFKDLPVRGDAFQFSDLLQHDALAEGIEYQESLSESQIVALANKQAEREDTFHVLKKENDQLKSEIEDLEKELELHREQEAVLKSALREADQLKQQMRTKPPENLDFQYLKNTVIKLMTTGESEALLPVMGKLLHFTEDEVQHLTLSIQDLKRKREEEAAGSSSLLSPWTEWWT